MDMPEIIETERLLLVKPEQKFALAQEIFAAVEISRATLRQWLPWVDATLSPDDEYSSYLLNYCAANWQKHSGFPYIIRLKDTNDFIGSVDLMGADDKHHKGEIGYWLCDNAVGHGYMQEAVLALEKTGFAQGLNRIIIKNDTRNLRSVNVAKRCGYHLDGVLRQDRWSEYSKMFVDTNVFSKLKSEA